jgi:uncharacterized protein (DUF1778 family)
MKDDDTRLSLRVKESDKDTWRRAAELDGRNLTNWIVTRLNRAAARELPEEAT